MSRTIRRVAIAAALASTVALAGAASASAASITALSDSAPLVQKLYVPVVLTASCDPDPFFPVAGTASVTIRQVVSGKNIAHGTGSISSMTCDGAQHDYTVNVFPDSGSVPFPGSGGGDSPPFQKGDAVVSATVGSYFGATATAGPEPIKLTK